MKLVPPSLPRSSYVSTIFFTIFSPLFNSSSSQFILIFHSPSSYLRPPILLNFFLSKISRACSSFFVIVHVSAPYVTTGLISVFYSRILVATQTHYKWQTYTYTGFHCIYFLYFHCVVDMKIGFVLKSWRRRNKTLMTVLVS